MKVRDLRLENQGLTTRKCYRYGPKYNFNEAKHRFLYDYYTEIIHF